ncbi:HD domain-containing protein, partial [Escherichia coli]|uniref:HD domain-containing protein n=1 Tax=Escherichia coli TaxID=562 RepID=UPI0020403A4B
MRKYPLSLLKDKNIVTFFDFWGKTRRGEKDGGDDYHLLCWHSLDVAAMGYLMVKRNCFGGNDSNLLIVFYVQIMPDDFVMQ